MELMSPDEVLAQIASALPHTCRDNVIIVGSLAAGFHFFSGDPERAIRTKDVDCMFTPHASAVTVAHQVTEQLFDAQWQQRQGAWSTPGDASTPEDKLPLVRLAPPGQAQWFLELLGAPDLQRADSPAKAMHRIETNRGHFALCSFRYLGLVEWRPILTEHGLRIARPEMMALANLLHHPRVAPDLISGTGGWKRSNKDLGRVLALAWLTRERDVRHDTQDLDRWAEHMAQALRERFPDEAKALATGVGAGLRQMLRSERDLVQALRICNLGLLASLEVGEQAFKAIGEQVLAEVIEPLEVAFSEPAEGSTPDRPRPTR